MALAPGRGTDLQSPAVIVCQRPAAAGPKRLIFRRLPPAAPDIPESPIVPMAPSKRTCPLCQARKAKRFCPAKQAHICPVCCGQKREVEIDCPSDCVYLHSGREYERARRFRQGEAVQLTERLWSKAFQTRNMELLMGLWTTIDQSRSEFPSLVDADVREVLNRLTRTFRTLESGLHYDHVPDTFTQKALYGSLKSLLDKPRKPEDLSTSTPKTADVLDCLQLILEMAHRSDPSRPRSRDFLDWIAAMVSEAVDKRSQLEEPPGIILP